MVTRSKLWAWSLSIGLLLLTVGLLSLAGYTLCQDGVCPGPAYDGEILSSFYGARNSVLDRGFEIITWAGSLYVLIPALLLIFLFQQGRPSFLNVAYVCASLLTAAILARIVKLLVARPRPEFYEALVLMPVDSSFPSAHTMQATAVAVACACLPNGRNMALAAAVAVVAILVAVSRIYLQVHYPTDVVAGALAATVCALAVRSLPIWQPPYEK
jgi:undecaprenyl-diphosphatase